MTERWLPVVGYEGWYEVSNLGQVKRVCAGPGTHAGRILKGYVPKAGYRVVSLGKNCPSKGFYVHHLVAAAFIGPRPDGKNINHDDTIKGNNSSDNLEYTTYHDNVLHATKLGLMPHGTQKWSAKLNDDSVKKIKKLLGTCYHREIAAMFGVQRKAISDIATGKTWKHVT